MKKRMGYLKLHEEVYHAGRWLVNTKVWRLLHSNELASPSLCRSYGRVSPSLVLMGPLR